MQRNECSLFTGCMTVSEIMKVMDAGNKMIKLFP